MKIVHLLPFVLAIPAICSAQNTFPASGNVGIGTTSPGSVLDVRGTVSVRGNGDLYFHRDDGFTGGSSIILDAPGAGTSDLWIRRNGGGAINGFHVDAATTTFTDGNVGIGTTSPGQRLTIVNTSAGDGIWMASNSTSDLALLTNMGVGAWNPLTQAGDSLILFRGSAQDGTDSGGLVIGSWSSSNKGIRIDTNGNVGIGATTPGAKLDVAGNIKMSGGRSVILNHGDNGTTDIGGLQMVTYDNGLHTILTPTNQNATPIDSTIRLGGFGNFNANTVGFRVSGDIGIGTANPRAKLDVWSGDLMVTGNDINGTAYVTSHGGTAYFGNNTYNNGMAIDPNGNVGIGTANPGTYKLAVNGTIHTKEVVVDTAGWSDYVFKPGYRLAPLNEVQATIRREGHLPGLPSAQEVAEHGVSVGEMQAKLLAKIEELTLHQIEQEKEISALKAANSDQSRQIQQLRAAAHLPQR